MWSMSAGGTLVGTLIAAALLLHGRSEATECETVEIASERDGEEWVATGMTGASGMGGGSVHSLCEESSGAAMLLPKQNTQRRQKLVSDKELKRRRERFGS